jgi:hypothetical protein
LCTNFKCQVVPFLIATYTALASFLEKACGLYGKQELATPENHAALRK